MEIKLIANVDVSFHAQIITTNVDGMKTVYCSIAVLVLMQCQTLTQFYVIDSFKFF